MWLQVFTTLVLLTDTQFTMGKFLSLAVQSASESWVSIKRIERVLLMEVSGACSGRVLIGVIDICFVMETVVDNPDARPPKPTQWSRTGVITVPIDSVTWLCPDPLDLTRVYSCVGNIIRRKQTARLVNPAPERASTTMVGDIDGLDISSSPPRV